MTLTHSIPTFLIQGKRCDGAVPESLLPSLKSGKDRTSSPLNMILLPIVRAHDYAPAVVFFV